MTERAALAGARWLGRADQEAAEEAAFSGARFALESLPISGRIVIGAPEGADQLAVGTRDRHAAATRSTSRSIRSRAAASRRAAATTRSR